VRVEGALDRPHQVELVPVLSPQRLALAQTDPMFTRARAATRQCVVEQLIQIAL
jgi:hypothetical protein